MWFAPGTLVMVLAITTSVAAIERPLQDAASGTPSPSPSTAAAPSPTPKYKLVPYGFETVKDRTTVPLLRFEDAAEVRSLEMNAAIARFFDKSDEKGNMLRGATPGGAPTLRDMAPYRPHVTPALNLLGVAAAAAMEIQKQIDNHKRMPSAEPSPTPSPRPR